MCNASMKTLQHKSGKTRFVFLFEVMHNSLSQGSFAFGLCLHPLPQRVRLVSIHVNFSKEVKFNGEPVCELFNLCVRPRLLRQIKQSSLLKLWMLINRVETYPSAPFSSSKKERVTLAGFHFPVLMLKLVIQNVHHSINTQRGFERPTLNKMFQISCKWLKYHFWKQLQMSELACPPNWLHGKPRMDKPFSA